MRFDPFSTVALARDLEVGQLVMGVRDHSAYIAGAMEQRAAPPTRIVLQIANAKGEPELRLTDFPAEGPLFVYDDADLCFITKPEDRHDKPFQDLRGYTGALVIARGQRALMFGDVYSPRPYDLDKGDIVSLEETRGLSGFLKWQLTARAPGKSADDRVTLLSWTAKFKRD